MYMSIFNYTNYKTFIREKVQNSPKKGRGQYRQLALHLHLNSTVVSQIFKGSRHLNPEQALQLCEHYGFSELETKYFVNMVNKERAGTEKLKAFYQREEKKMAQESKNIKSRIIEHKEISDEHKAIFYSNWYYSGLRLLTSIPQYQSVEEMSQHLQLPLALVQKVVNFLLETGLCVEINGKLSIGPQHTHLDAQSPLINNHRRNWRLKAVEQMTKSSDTNLFYSAPVTLSQKDFVHIQEEMVALIAKVIKRIEKSPEEQMACLNIDWFTL